MFLQTKKKIKNHIIITSLRNHPQIHTSSYAHRNKLILTCEIQSNL
jgi:hypothetical protein